MTRSLLLSALAASTLLALAGAAHADGETSTTCRICYDTDKGRTCETMTCPAGAGASMRGPTHVVPWRGGPTLTASDFKPCPSEGKHAVCYFHPGPRPR